MKDSIDLIDAAVRRYYKFVDIGDLDAVEMCFALDAVYNRPGYPQLRGRANIRKFYEQERLIDSGQHFLECSVVQRDSVAVRGTFRGILRGGAVAAVGFADFFVLDELGGFRQRDTYFFSPAI